MGAKKCKNITIGSSALPLVAGTSLLARPLTQGVMCKKGKIMKVLRIILTGVFSILVAVGLVSVILGKVPIGSVIILLAYVAVGMGLNGKGGKPVRYISIFVGGVLSLFLLAAIYSAVSPLLGENFDLMLFIASMLIGLIGLGTIYCIVKLKQA